MTVSSPRQPRRALSQGPAKGKCRGHSCTMPGYGTVLEPSPQYPAPGRFRCCLLDVPPVTGETHTHSLPRGSTVPVHAPKPASHNSRLPHMRAALGTPWVPMMCIFPLPFHTHTHTHTHKHTHTHTCQLRKATVCAGCSARECPVASEMASQPEGVLRGRGVQGVYASTGRGGPLPPPQHAHQSAADSALSPLPPSLPVTWQVGHAVSREAPFGAATDWGSGQDRAFRPRQGYS